MEINISSQAIEKIQDIMKENNKQNHALRIGIVSFSCSSYIYDLDFQQTPSKQDIVIKKNGLKIFVAKKSIGMLNGLKIDYDEDKQGFQINNPNIKKSKLPILQ